MLGFEINVNTQVIDPRVYKKDFVFIDFEDYSQMADLKALSSAFLASKVDVGVVYRYMPGESEVLELGTLGAFLFINNDQYSDTELKAVPASINFMCTAYEYCKLQKLGLADSRKVCIMRVPAFDNGEYSADSMISPEKYADYWLYSKKGNLAGLSCNLIAKFVDTMPEVADEGAQVVETVVEEHIVNAEKAVEEDTVIINEPVVETPAKKTTTKKSTKGRKKKAEE